MIVSISGIVIDRDSGWPISVMMEVIDNNTMHIKGSFTSNPIDGRYNISLPSGGIYSLVVVDNDNYLYCSDEFDIINPPDTMPFIQNIVLNKTIPDSIFDLGNVFFITGSNIIDEKASFPVIYKFFKMLNNNPNIYVDLLGEPSKISSFIEEVVELGINKERLSLIQNDSVANEIMFRIKKRNI